MAREDFHTDLLGPIFVKRRPRPRLLGRVSRPKPLHFIEMLDVPLRIRKKWALDNIPPEKSTPLIKLLLKNSKQHKYDLFYDVRPVFEISKSIYENGKKAGNIVRG